LMAPRSRDDIRGRSHGLAHKTVTSKVARLAKAGQHRCDHYGRVHLARAHGGADVEESEAIDAWKDSSKSRTSEYRNYSSQRQSVGEIAGGPSVCHRGQRRARCV